MAIRERPQERLERHGANALSDTELLAMLLRSGTPVLDVLSLANRLIQEAGSFNGLLKYAAEDFLKYPGIGKVKSLQLITVMEIARRILADAEPQAPILDDPMKIFRMMIPQTKGLSVEKFWILALNTKNRLLKQCEVSSGTATASLVHPREVFREAIRQSATSVICVHNHPSGDPSPSHADIQVTKTLRESASVLQITLLDHIIIGNPQCDPAQLGFYSFSASGLL